MADDGYVLTVHGLRRKRQEVVQDIEDMRARTVRRTHDLEAIDRILALLGSEDILPEPTAREARLVLFHRGELRRWVKTELAKHGPATNRMIAERIAPGAADDPHQIRLMPDLLKRVAKSMRALRDAGLVTKHWDGKRGWVWSLTDEPSQRAALAHETKALEHEESDRG